jgi:hypothetical protein
MSSARDQRRLICVSQEVNEMRRLTKNSLNTTTPCVAKPEKTPRNRKRGRVSGH